MELTSELRALAKIFAGKSPLYLVGGGVRNALLGLPIGDYDITSRATPNEVIEMLSGSAYTITAEYARTGTLLIRCGKDKYEYTTFREDSYPIGSGEHSPSEVKFTDDMQADALRRDFTCNALYYDILTDEVIDLVGGVADINDRVLRTVRSGDITLSEDALRIMRLARFSTQLAFTVDEETLSSARRYARGLRDISVERIHDELRAVLNAPEQYGARHLDGRQVLASDGIRLLVDIGAMEYIIPELLDTIGVHQNDKYHIYDVYNHMLHAMDNVPAGIRLVGLLHDIAKPVMIKEIGVMHGHAERGEEMTIAIMTRLKFANSDIERVSKLVGLHMFNLDNKAKDSTIRRFIASNFEYIDDYISLRCADGMASRRANYNANAIERIQQLRQSMIEQRVPRVVREMDINGHDIKELGYQGEEIGEVLDKLLEEQVTKGERYEREYMLTRARR